MTIIESMGSAEDHGPTRSGGLRISLLGCGRIATLFHLPILARAPDVELRAIAEADPGRRTGAGRLAPGAALLPDWEEALRDDGCDAVVVALPTPLHAEAARAAFEAGKHVYLEKPVAVDLEQAERVEAAWRQSGRIGTTGFNGRFDPAVRSARRAIESGRVGRPVGIRIALGAASRELPGWKRSRATGGGVLLDLGSHAVDLARFLKDAEVARARALVSSIRTEDDTATISMALDDGTLVEAFLSLAGVQESVVEVVGDGGVFVSDRYARRTSVRPVKPAYGRREHLARGIRRLVEIPRVARDVLRPPDDAASFRGALGAFVTAASGGAFEGADIEDGRRSLETVLAVEEGARGRGAGGG